MMRSCELVTTVAFCTLLCLALSMPPLYWAANAAPWLWRSYLGFTLTADSRVSSWYIFKQRVHTVYLLPSTAFVVLLIWHRTWPGEHRHGMPHNVSSPTPAIAGRTASSKKAQTLRILTDCWIYFSFSSFLGFNIIIWKMNWLSSGTFKLNIVSRYKVTLSKLWAADFTQCR